MSQALDQIRAACPVHGDRTFLWKPVAGWWACEEYVRHPGLGGSCLSVVTEEQVVNNPDGDCVVQDARAVVPRPVRMSHARSG